MNGLPRRRKRFLMRTVGMYAAILLVIATGFFLTVRLQAHAVDAMTPLGGQVAPLVQQSQMVQPMDSQQSLNLTISLQMRNKAELDQMIQEMYTPGSPQYHH